jgi:hypothetical protein
MPTPQEMKIREEFDNEILELIDNQDDYPRGDLQGVVSGIVMRLLIEGRKLERLEVNK